MSGASPYDLPDDPDAVPHLRWRLVGLVALGGALGTALRWGLAEAIEARPGHWPVATTAANLAGCLLLGWLLERLVGAGPDTGSRLRARLLVGTGFCGGLTTYSALALETAQLGDDGHGVLAVTYLIASIGGGALVTLLGVLLAARRPRPS